MLYRAILLVLSPLISLFLLSAGDSYFTTFASIRLDDVGYTSNHIALINAGYSIGTLVGSFAATSFIIRVLHIRAYAAFSAKLAVSTLMLGMSYSFWWWMLFRFCCGACIYGLFITIESWLLELSNNKTRGQILSIYTIFLYSAQVVSQQFLNLSGVETLMPFCVICILITLSIIPVASTKAQAPKVDIKQEGKSLNIRKLFKMAPIGMLTCIIGGMTLRTIYVFLPLSLEGLAFNTFNMTALLSILSLGGMLLQYPIGKVSDVKPRKEVIFYLCVAIAILCFITLFVASSFAAMVVMMFLIGGTTFTLYPLGVSYACDNIAKEDIVPATSALLFVYGFGAIIGPLIEPAFELILPNRGIFIFLSLLAVTLAIVVRVYNPKAQTIVEQAEEIKEGKQEYAVVPNTTPIATELDPRGEDVELTEVPEFDSDEIIEFEADTKTTDRDNKEQTEDDEFKDN